MQELKKREKAMRKGETEVNVSQLSPVCIEGKC